MPTLPRAEVQTRGISRRVQRSQYRAVLDLTIEEALSVFQDVPARRPVLVWMTQVGLGYLQLGQRRRRYRRRSAARQARQGIGRRAGGTYHLYARRTDDRLHLADIAGLLILLQQLVDGRQYVVVSSSINVDVIRSADWEIDLGSEGGPRAGRSWRGHTR